MKMEKLRAWLQGAAKSWTMRFNAAMGALLVGMPLLQESMPQLAPYIDPKTYKDAMLAVLVINILLRIRTKTALGDK